MDITLSEIIEQAIHDLGYYRNPDLEEFEKRIDEILKAGNQGWINGDTIIYIAFDKEYLNITTEYSIRSCLQTQTYKIPKTVLESDDPIKAMKNWDNRQKVSKAKEKVRMAQCSLNWALEELKKAEES